jgi:integrase
VPGLRVLARGKSWSYRLELPPDPLTSKRRFEWKGGHASEAAAWEAGIVARADEGRGQRVQPARRTVETYLTEWLNSIEASVKPGTHTNYSDYTAAYVIPHIGTKKLQDLDVPTLNELYRRLLVEGRRKPDNNARMYAHWVQHQDIKPAQLAEACGTSIHAARHAVLRYRRGRLPVVHGNGLEVKTVLNVHRMLHRALSDAVAWRYLSYNPAVHAALPRVKRRSGPAGAAWTIEQLTAWLAVALEDRFAGIWVLAASTGMRRSELAGVERRLLDLDEAVLTIADTRVVVAGHAVDSDGKTTATRRTIALDPFTVERLRPNLANLDHEAATVADYPDHGLIVCHPDGRLLHPDTITHRFNSLVDKASVPRIRLHDVRHTYATLALDAGVDPKILADRLGHASMAYTLQIYTHRSTGKDRSAAEKVAGLLFGSGENAGSNRQAG